MVYLEVFIKIATNVFRIVELSHNEFLCVKFKKKKLTKFVFGDKVGQNFQLSPSFLHLGSLSSFQCVRKTIILFAQLKIVKYLVN